MGTEEYPIPFKFTLKGQSDINELLTRTCRAGLVLSSTSSEVVTEFADLVDEFADFVDGEQYRMVYPCNK